MSRVLRKRYGHMARRRSDFKDRIVNQLGGALREFYKAHLAMKNGQIQWVGHWLSEAERIINYGIVDDVTHTVRGFTDRHKAFEEAVKEVQRDDARYRRVAEGFVKRDFRLTKLRAHLDATDTQDFWALVDAAVRPALARSGPWA